MTHRFSLIESLDPPTFGWVWPKWDISKIANRGMRIKYESLFTHSFWWPAVDWILSSPEAQIIHWAFPSCSDRLCNYSIVFSFFFFYLKVANSSILFFIHVLHYPNSYSLAVPDTLVWSNLLTNFPLFSKVEQFKWLLLISYILCR